ncbi:hypothetical protein F4782DRAFT_534367 [Xylaria castorea]|nr:hypothetical protein F4782DRAFT_534367 [Xylaria castorea]
MASPTNVKMRGMDPNCVVDNIMSRSDCYDIHNKLFDRLFGKYICQWIKTRPDRKELYQDLFDHALAEINACNPNQGQERQQSTPACRSTHIALKKEDSIPDTNSPCKYMAPYNNFEPQTPGLGLWVPMFMTKKEIYDAVPAMESLDKEISESLLTFIPYLNPNYIGFRLNYMLNYAETGIGSKFPDMRSAEDTVQAWNNARGFGLRNNLIRTFAAVSCFNHFKHLQEAVVSSRLLDDPARMSGYFEDSACAMFARLDHGSNYHNTSIQDKWRGVKNLGANLSILARNFGGEGFLILFPFCELESRLRERLLEFHSTSALWKVLSDLLHSTEMGNFFRSMAACIGVPLINKFYGEPSCPQHELVEQLGTLRLQYFLPSVPRYTHWLTESVLAKQANGAPFWCCVGPKPIHLTANLSLSPLSLAQIVGGGHLTPEIVEHLIRQQLPREWTVLGREDISHPATKELLLRDNQGIMIPLFIDNGWTLFCYRNPIRSEVDYLIKCISPSGNHRRHNAASKMLSTWIPRDAPWIPQGLKLRLIELVHSQSATETDSGIHIIVNAIAMAKTGKPESRPLNEQICKGLRIKYFVHLLNELQEAVNKAGMKNARWPIGTLWSQDEMSNNGP